MPLICLGQSRSEMNAKVKLVSILVHNEGSFIDAEEV